MNTDICAGFIHCEYVYTASAYTLYAIKNAKRTSMLNATPNKFAISVNDPCSNTIDSLEYVLSSSKF